MTHVTQGVFQVVGHLVEGWLTVEYVRHCEILAATQPLGDRVVYIRDDLWIDRVPVSLVAIEDRMPNTLLRITVRDRTEVIFVERDHTA